MDRISIQTDGKALLHHIEVSIRTLQDMRKYVLTASAMSEHTDGAGFRTVAAQCMDAGKAANNAAAQATTIATRIKEGKY